MAYRSDNSTPADHAGSRLEGPLFVVSVVPWSGSTFDLDEALTCPVVHEDSQDYSNPPPTNGAIPAERVVSDMPVVACGGVCAICVEEISIRRNGKRMPCSHVYHADCITRWLSRSDGSCPLCRCLIRRE